MGMMVVDSSCHHSCLKKEALPCEVKVGSTIDGEPHECHKTIKRVRIHMQSNLLNCMHLTLRLLAVKHYINGHFGFTKFSYSLLDCTLFHNVIVL